MPNFTIATLLAESIINLINLLLMRMIINKIPKMMIQRQKPPPQINTLEYFSLSGYDSGRVTLNCGGSCEDDTVVKAEVVIVEEAGASSL